jgi:hypothetical protein
VSNGTSQLQLTFRRVVSDNRCPGDAMCIAGSINPAVLEFYVVQTQTESLGSFSMGAPTHIPTEGPGSEYRVGVYTVRVEQLAPYRFASLPPIKPEDWRATVRITSALP